MPGIFGLFTKMPREWAEPQLHRMLSSVRHEPSDKAGMCIDESLGSYAGWVAKAGSFSDGMPLRNERGDMILLFSGEEFPDPSKARELQDHGHEFDTDGPDYLVHWCEDDAAFPAGLNGRFHGLLKDRSRGAAMLFNDRYGVHRLYYHESKEALYFAAEAKAILAVRPELRAADPRGLGELVTCGCVLENRTLFPGIFVLPPGSAWSFRDGALVQKAAYFRPEEWKNQEPLDQESYYQELRRVFSRNLPRYFDGRQHVGMSLTGGLDTRMIMAWQRSAPGSLPCYSFGGMFRDCEDVVLARKVAHACGQSHQVIEVGREFLSRFPQYAERAVFLTDGCVTVTRSSDLYANEKARQIAPVRMTGNYGSEIVRRVVAFKPSEPAPGLFHQDFLPRIKEATDTYTGLRNEHALAFIAFRQTPWHHYGLLSLEESQLSLRSPFLDNDLVRTAFRAPDSTKAKTDVFEENSECVRLIGDGNRTLQGMRTDRGLGGDTSLAGTLKRQMLEFTFKAEYAYDYGMPQWLAGLDHSVSGLHLERLFLGRHKFNHFRVWYRDALPGYVREMLLDSRTLARPYLAAANVECMVQGHLRGDRNYTSEIHTALTLELVHRLFVDRN